MNGTPSVMTTALTKQHLTLDLKVIATFFIVLYETQKLSNRYLCTTYGAIQTTIHSK